MRNNPSNLEIKLIKRIENGERLLAGLKKLPQVPPYATSILEAAKFGKIRVLEAHLSS